MHTFQIEFSGEPSRTMEVWLLAWSFDQSWKPGDTQITVPDQYWCANGYRRTLDRFESHVKAQAEADGTPVKLTRLSP